MSIPLFPNLKPRLMHSSWFDVDQPCDDEDEVSQLEREHQNWVTQKFFIDNISTDIFVVFQLVSIKQRNSDLTPIGKTAAEVSFLKLFIVPSTYY